MRDTTAVWKINLIRSLATAGFHARYIAEEVGCSVGAVHYYKTCSLRDYRNGLTSIAKETVSKLRARKHTRLKGVA